MIEDNSFLSVNIFFINCLYKSVLLLIAILLTTISRHQFGVLPIKGIPLILKLFLLVSIYPLKWLNNYVNIQNKGVDIGIKTRSWQRHYQELFLQIKTLNTSYYLNVYCRPTISSCVLISPPLNPLCKVLLKAPLNKTSVPPLNAPKLTYW